MPRTRSLAWSELKIGMLAVAALVSVLRKAVGLSPDRVPEVAEIRRSGPAARRHVGSLPPKMLLDPVPRRPYTEDIGDQAAIVASSACNNRPSSIAIG